MTVCGRTIRVSTGLGDGRQGQGDRRSAGREDEHETVKPVHHADDNSLAFILCCISGVPVIVLPRT